MVSGNACGGFSFVPLAKRRYAKAPTWKPQGGRSATKALAEIDNEHMIRVHLIDNRRVHLIEDVDDDSDNQSAVSDVSSQASSLAASGTGALMSRGHFSL